MPLVFQTATLETRRQYCDAFKIIKENDFQRRGLCLTKLLTKCEDKLKTFSNTHGLEECAIRSPENTEEVLN